MPPKVVIITLNWNDARTTLRLLGSLSSLDYTEAEVVVVDNGSDDGSADAIEASGAPARLIRARSNLGFGAGNNLALRDVLAQRAEFAWLVNNDAVVASGALHPLVELALQHPHAAAIGGIAHELATPERIHYWGGGRVFPSLAYARMAKGRDDRLDYLSGTSLLLRMEILNQVGFFDERFFLYWEDVDLCYRLRKAGYEMRVAPGSVIRHDWSQTTRRVPKVRAYHLMRSYVLFVRKHYPGALPYSISALAFQSACKLGRGNCSALRPMWRGWRDGWKEVLP